MTLLDGDPRRFGDPDGDLHASLAIASDRFYMRALADADIGFGESYMEGEWTSPDLVSLIRLMLRNMPVVEESGGLVRAVNSAVRLVARRLRDNTVSGSRKHIQRHYDLGNDFFRLFLDSKHLMYSCGLYRTPHDSLEKAQDNKLDQIGRKLDLSVRRSHPRNRQRLGRLRRLGGEQVQLPRDDDDDQRRAVPPCARVGAPGGPRRARARGAEGLPNTHRTV